MMKVLMFASTAILSVNTRISCPVQVILWMSSAENQKLNPTVPNPIIAAE